MGGQHRPRRDARPALHPPGGPRRRLPGSDLPTARAQHGDDLVLDHLRRRGRRHLDHLPPLHPEQRRVGQRRPTATPVRAAIQMSSLECPMRMIREGCRGPCVTTISRMVCASGPGHGYVAVPVGCAVRSSGSSRWGWGRTRYAQRRAGGGRGPSDVAARCTGQRLLRRRAPCCPYGFDDNLRLVASDVTSHPSVLKVPESRRSFPWPGAPRRCRPVVSAAGTRSPGQVSRSSRR
jgi:hypothetical protein